MNTPNATILQSQTAASQIAIATAAMIVFVVATLNEVPALVAAAVPLGIILTHQAPYVWCLLLTCFSFFRLNEAYPVLYPYRLPLFLGFASLAGVVWHALFTNKIRPFWTRELVLMLVLFGLVTVGVATAYNRPLAFDAVTTNLWKVVAVCLAIAWFLRSITDFHLTAWCILVSGSLVAAVAIYNAMNGIEFVEGNRVTIGMALKSPLGDPNDLAAMLIFPLSFALAFICFPPNVFQRSAAVCTFVLTLSAIILTRSRGALLALVVVSLIFGVRFVKSRTLILCFSVLVGITLFVAMGISARESGGAAEYADGGIDESSAGRFAAWQTAIVMALHRPFTGVGIDNFKDAYFAYAPAWTGRSIVAHSSWFGMLGELGIPGLAVFVAMIYAALKSCLSSLSSLRRPTQSNLMRGMALGCLAGLGGYVTTGTFLSNQFAWSVYLLIAITAAIHRHVVDNVSNQDSPLEI